MDILENREEWQAEFEENWLAHYEKTGETLWGIYNLPHNDRAPGTPGIDLSQSRLVLISSAGGYLSDRQRPFDAESDLGDYSIRTFSSGTQPRQIAFAHTHYDHAAVNEDQQVLVPLAHLHQMVNEGLIGEIAPSVISFMGYQPIATKVVDETVPSVLEVARAEQVDAALLVPS